LFAPPAQKQFTPQWDGKQQTSPVAHNPAARDRFREFGHWIVRALTQHRLDAEAPARFEISHIHRVSVGRIELDGSNTGAF